MSLHLTLEALGLAAPEGAKFTPRHKLAMVAYGDSGDESSRRSMPGLEAVMEAASVHRSRALAITDELIRMGLLARWKQGYRGHRAEFLVFPNGCCEKHGPLLIDGVLWSEHLTAVAASKPKGSATVDPFPAVGIDTKGPGSTDPIAASKGPRTADPIDTKGSTDTTQKGSTDTTQKGSTKPPERVHPARSNSTPSVKHSVTTTTPTLVTRQDFVRRAQTDDTGGGPSLDFRQMVDGHPAEPARELAGACGNCERGWIIGADGTPIEKCPCHRGYRPPHLDVVAGTDAIEAG